MQDDIREQLIKQFPSDVVEILDQSGKPYYGCLQGETAENVRFPTLQKKKMKMFMNVR